MRLLLLLASASGRGRRAFPRMGIDQLRAWIAAGGTVLFGTDTGYMADYDPAEEYELMAQAGMSARQILAALTTAPAERFGESDRTGRIAPGLAADLVVLDGDPARDVRAFAAVRCTIRSGRVIYRSAGAAGAAPAAVSSPPP